MDLAWNALDAELPTSATGSGDAFNPDVTPVKLETHFQIPANDWRPEIKLSWYQGGAMPDSPYARNSRIGHGAMFVGGENHQALPPRSSKGIHSSEISSTLTLARVGLSASVSSSMESGLY